jgi:O-antigen ligase
MTANLVLLTISLLPLYVIRFSVGGLPTTVLEVLILLSALFWVVGRLKEDGGFRGLVEAFKTPFSTAIVVFLVAGTISLLMTPNWWAGLGLYRAYFWEPVLLFIIVNDVFKNNMVRPLFGLITSGILVAIMGLLQYFSGQAFFDSAVHEFSQGRVPSLYNSANALALYLGPLLALILPFGLMKTRYKVFLLTSVGLFLFTIILTKSLGSFLSLILVGVVYLVVYLAKKHREKILRRVLPVFVILSGVGFGLLLLYISSFTPKTGLVYPRPYDGTIAVRLCLWEGTKGLLGEKFFSGSGLAGFPQTYSNYRTCDTELLQYPHNIFLNFWTELGLLGLLAFLYLVYQAKQAITKSSVEWPIQLGLIGYLLMIFGHGLFDVPYFKNDLSAQFWVYLSLVLILVRSKKVTDW